MNKAYADGGVYKHNPSRTGGAWAYVIKGGSTNYGVIKGEVTNNLMEYYAVYMLLKALPDGWEGQVLSDSKITLGRIFYGWRCRNIPFELQEGVKKELERLGAIFPVHIRGHQKNNGDEDIYYNRMCDSLCKKAMKEAFEEVKNDKKRE